MYKLGVFACIFVVMLVGACRCSIIASGTCLIEGAIPTLYIAGESTPRAENFVVTPIPTPPHYSIPGLYNVNHIAPNTQGTAWLNKTTYISIS